MRAVTLDRTRTTPGADLDPEADLPAQSDAELGSEVPISAAIRRSHRNARLLP